MKEIWKDIKGYETLYQVSNLGRVKSIKNGRNRLLKPALISSGYYQVQLQNRRFLIHRLVAEAFIKAIPEGYVVDHIDRNKLNNNVDNLRIITRAKNSSIANKGRKMTAEHKAKIALANTGRTFSHTEETKIKLSNAHRGKKIGPQTSEHKQNISVAIKSWWVQRKLKSAL